MKSKYDGFTLIELLVVISIIALLVGILLPALGAARKTAQNMKCLSNLKQIGIGVIAYAFNNDDKLPPAFSDGTGVNGWTEATEWPVIINAYITSSGNATYAEDGDENNTEAYICPSAPLEGGRLHYAGTRLLFPLRVGSIQPGSASFLDLYQTGFAVRSSEVAMIGDGKQTLDDFDTGPRSYSALDKIDGGRVTNRTHFFRGDYFRNDSVIGDPAPGIIGGEFDYRHTGSDGSVNLLYLDGHASNVGKEGVIVRMVRPDRPPGL
jgi:prepilin-type N-terminal cleavage/methylation domain-containing protein/prepilin-type processing-associated H-X9-DG protein